MLYAPGRSARELKIDTLAAIDAFREWMWRNGRRKESIEGVRGSEQEGLSCGSPGRSRGGIASGDFSIPVCENHFLIQVERVPPSRFNAKPAVRRTFMR